MRSVGLIWDIDGLVVDSPHEKAWRITAQRHPWDIKELDSDFYFKHVASRPRFEGGNNILELKGVYERMGARDESSRRMLLEKYCEEKNNLIRELIKKGDFRLFHDSVIQLFGAKKQGFLQAADSASKNAKSMIKSVDKNRIISEIGANKGLFENVDTLYSLFDVDACGLDLGDKRNIQKYAAEELKKFSKGDINRFIVFEDAPSGIEAAKSLGFYAVGVLRIGDEKALYRAGADIVTDDLRKIDLCKINI